MSIAQNGLISFVAAVTLCVMVSSTASARPNTSSFTCDGLKELIDQKGAVVLNTKSSSTYQVYGRYVANRSYCNSGESLLGIKVPTKSSSCRVKLCIKAEND